MVYRAHITAFLIFALLLVISGCGNGEGVGGPKTGAPNSVGIYYDLDPTHTCPSSTVYRNSISYDGSSYKHVDNCTGQETSLVAAQVERSSTFGVLGYAADIYEYRATKPTVGDASERYMLLFCRSNSGTKDVEFFVRTGPDITSDLGILSLESTNWEASYADVTAGTVGSVTTYEASGKFSLSVDSASSVNADEYAGTLSVNGEGATRPMTCRVVN